jgi:hypothetical protein
MPRVKARKSHKVVITLPPHLAAALHIEEGGYVDAQEVEGGVLLKPLSPEERRAAALDGLRAVQARVRPSPEMAQLSPEEQEAAIVRMLAEDD